MDKAHGIVLTLGCATVFLAVDGKGHDALPPEGVHVELFRPPVETVTVSIGSTGVTGASVFAHAGVATGTGAAFDASVSIATGPTGVAAATGSTGPAQIGVTGPTGVGSSTVVPTTRPTGVTGAAG
jgi:hypothetical protein